jgi:hypothetical protein
MALILRISIRFLLSFAGLVGIWFAVNRWLWFRTLPTTLFTRRCGNCFLGAVGVPTELGLLGLILTLALVLRIRWRHTMLLDWSCAVAGIWFTPEVIGVPLFAIGLLRLVVPIAKGTFERPIC